MSLEIEQRLDKIPVVNGIVRLLKKVRFSAMEGLSLYDIIEMYIIGIIQGTLSARASSIAFSLFLALFPLLIFLITLIPFVVRRRFVLFQVGIEIVNQQGASCGSFPFPKTHPFPFCPIQKHWYIKDICIASL